MSDFYIVDPFIGAPTPVTVTASTPKWPLGLECRAVDRDAASSLGGQAGVFVYARGSNMASAGQFVHLHNGSAVLLASGNSAWPNPIGVGAGNLSATNVYGWVQIQGRCDYARGTNTAPVSNVPTYFGATAGNVQSNVTTGLIIFGIVGCADVTATSAGAAGGYVYHLYRPFARLASAL